VCRSAGGEGRTKGDRLPENSILAAYTRAREEHKRLRTDCRRPSAGCHANDGVTLICLTDHTTSSLRNIYIYIYYTRSAVSEDEHNVTDLLL